MMKISVDNQIVRLFFHDTEKVLDSPLSSDESGHLNLDWPSLFEYLELGQVLSRLPSFDKSQVLFTACISALTEVDNPEDLFYIYDSLFTKMIEQVKSLPEVDASFLLQKMEEKKNKLSFWEMEKILSPALTAQEKVLKETPLEAMHDLVLYLAWDRMCICMARIFDYPSTHPKFLDNLKKLKWCLIESFQHIASQGRTTPSFYRLIEALFYYLMREEHLSLHPEADWELLTKSFPVLKDSNELVDVFYIDHALVPESAMQEGSFCHLTVDPPEVVQSRLALANYMIERLKQEIPQWNYALRPGNIIHLSA
jgi:hypothetical protein